MDSTISYYDEHAEDFCRSTLPVDFSGMREAFTQLLPPGGEILDLGCGSGRDALAFRDGGYRVTACDGSAEICRIAGRTLGMPVRRMDFRELSDEQAYDGIWACASLLHLPADLLPEVFARIRRALRPGGIVYTSFKYGAFEGMRNGRHFTDLDEARLTELVRAVPGLEILRLWTTGDARPGREEEKWLNALMKKTGPDGTSAP